MKQSSSFLSLMLFLMLGIAPANAQVNVVFASTDSITCAPACALFMNGTPGTLSCTWNFGDPASGINDTISGNPGGHCFLTAGTYTVTLNVHTASGNGSGTKVVHVYPVPEALFTAVNIGGNTWKFTSNSTGSIASLTWYFGDPLGNTSTVSPVTFTYPTSGA
ncbi:MAG TPA: PKD domain-containing protein, partial [Bacteroidia bacterium]|nr:PKD domain-containing protein [Bacteroidia bacterium]